VEGYIMNRVDYENKSFDELISQLCEEGVDTLVSYESLKEYAVCSINEDNLFSALNILDALCDGYANWYNYDLGLITPLTCKEDLESYVED
jgi:hypothetical protein